MSYANRGVVFKSRLLWLCVLCLGQVSCVTFGDNTSDNFDTFAHWRSVNFNDQDLHFVEAGIPGKPLVVFIHGTPGSWLAFQTYLEDPRLNSNLHLIALDRPGFGRSNHFDKSSSFAAQAAAIAELLKLNQSPRKVTLVGHSLGGSIGYRVATDYNAQVGAVLAISAALDPTLSEPRWYNYVAKFPLVKWALPNELATANKEMMPLADELNDLREGLGKLELPITIIQGHEDGLVHVGNIAYAQEALHQAQVKVVEFPEHGHFIIWEEHDQVVDEILRLAAELEPSSTPVVLNVTSEKT